MSIYKKLNEFKKIVGGVKKNASNPFHKNKYATIESVLETIETPLNEVGLGFVQCVDDMFLVTTIYSDDDEKTITSRIPLILAKNDMQQLGSAITYARRYALVSMFGLEQEDDDGNKASGYEKQQPKPQPRITPQQITELETLLHEKQVDRVKFFNWLGVNNLGDIAEGNFAKVKETLLKK